MAGVTRRAFLGYSVAMPLVLEELAYAQSKEDSLWEETRKKPSSYQKALDETLKSSPEVQKSVSRFYAAYVADVKSTRQKGALIWGKKQLRCHDSRLEKELGDEVQKYAEAYAKSHNSNPNTLKEETGRAFGIIVAELIDRAENKPTDKINIMQHSGADAYLEFSLWGSGFKAIGIATKQFFEDENYKTAEDRKSYLLDNVGLKAADQVNNTKAKEVWTSIRFETKISAFYTGVIPGMKDDWTAVLKNRWLGAQAENIVAKKRMVSEVYQRAMSSDWQNSPEFKHIVASHKKNLAEAPQLKSIAHREINSDSMARIWCFKYLPLNGAIVAYDPELVKKYQFDSK